LKINKIQSVKILDKNREMLNLNKNDMKKQIKVYVISLIIGILGSVFGGLITDVIKGLPPFTTWFGFFVYSIEINLFVVIAIVMFCFLFLFLFIKNTKKMNFYKVKYEKYKEDFFPKNKDASFIRITVERSVELYKYGALVEDLYKHLPAYKISREDNIIVAWITTELTFKRLDEILKKIRDSNTYIKFDWLVVGV
jgi:hypothetical protein